jgi:hypothetical protein
VPFVSFPGGCMALGTPAMQWDLCWRPSWARHSALSSEDSMPGNNPRRLYTLCVFFLGAYFQTYTNHNVLDHVGQVLLSRYSIWFIRNIQHFQSSSLSKLFGSSALHQWQWEHRKVDGVDTSLSYFFTQLVWSRRELGWNALQSTVSQKVREGLRSRFPKNDLLYFWTFV